MSEVTFEELVLRHQLKKLLEQRRMTASDLSRRTAIARQVISDWLAGSKPRKIEQLRLVARFFGVTIDELCFQCEPAAAELSQRDEAPALEGEWLTGVVYLKVTKPGNGG